MVLSRRERVLSPSPPLSCAPLGDLGGPEKIVVRRDAIDPDSADAVAVSLAESSGDPATAIPDVAAERGADLVRVGASVVSTTSGRSVARDSFSRTDNYRASQPIRYLTSRR